MHEIPFTGQRILQVLCLLCHGKGQIGWSCTNGKGSPDLAGGSHEPQAATANLDLGGGRRRQPTMDRNRCIRDANR